MMRWILGLSAPERSGAACLLTVEVEVAGTCNLNPVTRLSPAAWLLFLISHEGIIRRPHGRRHRKGTGEFLRMR